MPAAEVIEPSAILITVRRNCLASIAANRKKKLRAITIMKTGCDFTKHFEEHTRLLSRT